MIDQGHARIQQRPEHKRRQEIENRTEANQDIRRAEKVPHDGKIYICAEVPPSTTICWPVTKDEASDAR